jgi:hypothetical protein
MYTSSTIVRICGLGTAGVSYTKDSHRILVGKILVKRTIWKTGRKCKVNIRWLLIGK